MKAGPMTRLVLAAAACLLWATAQAAPPAADAPASGPTPYPKDAKDWPGQGAIRTFGWMVDNRKAFWAQRDKARGAVVFAGDSLIGGWTQLAKDFPGLPVANRGIGGDVSRGLLFRLQEDVLDLQPRAIVLLTGSNDLSAQQPPRQARANIDAMLDMIQRETPGVPVVLCTIPPRQDPKAPVDPARVAELNTLIQQAARGRSNVAVLDLHALLAAPDGSPEPAYFGADKLHITTAGFKRFHEGLVPLFDRLNVR